MTNEIITLLSLRRLPGRVTSEQAAPLLGFAIHDMPVLVRAKLLKPLGNPGQQAVKYFAASDIEKCATDPDWLNRATKAIYLYWGKQNARRHTRHDGVKAKVQLIAA
jgi:hypothetical protein